MKGYLQDHDPKHLEAVTAWLRQHAEVIERIEDFVASASAYHYAGRYEEAETQVRRAWTLLEEVNF